MTEQSKNNIFVRMSDRQDVVEFVKEIEKYQYLYDQNSIHYSNKLLKSRTWQNISKKYRTSVSDCKDKWRKIRIAYMRSLKLNKGGKQQSRPYYLAEYLQFISPNKNADDNAPTNSVDSPVSSEINNKEIDDSGTSDVPTNSAASPAPSEVSIKVEVDEYGGTSDVPINTIISPEPSEMSLELKIDDDGGMLDVDYNVNDNEQVTHVNTRENQEEIDQLNGIHYHQRSSGNSIHIEKPEQWLYEREKHRMQEEVFRESVKESNSVHIETQKSCLCCENSPRKMFLMSLLPDLETLTEQEMRSFRREVIALLDRFTVKESL